MGAGHTGFALVLDVAKHLVLPATTLALFFMAIYTRMTRTSMLDAAQQDYVKTARAKGLKPGVIQRRHVLRNALQDRDIDQLQECLTLLLARLFVLLRGSIL